jgi:hypothetical protein
MSFEPEVDPRQWAENISLSPEGLWVSQKSSAISYPSEGNDYYLRIEEGSFWFKHRNDCLLKVLQQYPPGGVLFDVGGGNGFISRFLGENGSPTILVEPGQVGVRNAKSRGVRPIIQSSFEAAGFKTASLPAIGGFDLVEHLGDDHGFLRMLRSKMTKGGRIYLTVPAYQWLWSQEDHWAGHYRRYNRNQLKYLLESEGFQLEYLSYFFTFLVPPIYLIRAFPYSLGFNNKKSPEVELSEHHAPKRLAGFILKKLLEIEKNRIGKQTLPFGSSCLAVGRI